MRWHVRLPMPRANRYLAIALLVIGCAHPKARAEEDDLPAIDPVAYWVERLGSDEVQLRRTALAALARLDEPPQRGYVGGSVAGPIEGKRTQHTAARAVPRIAAALHDADEEVRDLAACALGDLAESAAEAVPDLAVVLQDKSPKVRSSAAYALGRIGVAAHGSVDALLHAAQDPDEEVRSSALGALSSIGPLGDEAIPILLEALRDPGQGSGSFAQAALAAMGKRAIPELVKAASSDEIPLLRAALCTLGQMTPLPDEAAPALAAALHHADQDVRRIAATLLRGIDRERDEVVASLVSDLSDQDAGVRCSAACLLRSVQGHVGPAVHALIPLVNDADARVRSYALDAIGHAGVDAKEAIPVLIEALGREDRETCAAAARALGRIGPTAHEAIPALWKLRDTFESNDCAVSLALSRIGTEASPKALDLLRTGSCEKRVYAIMILQGCGKDSPEAVDAVRKAAFDAEETAASRALDALLVWGKSDLPTVLEVLDGPREKLRGRAAQFVSFARVDPEVALAVLTHLLSDTNDQVRWEAASGLCKLGAPALPCLRAALKDDAPGIRSAALSALLRSSLLPADEEAKLEAEVAADRDPATRALAIGCCWTRLDGLPRLLAGLSDESPIVREAALRGLWDVARFAHRDADRAVPALIKLLADPDPHLQQMATYALQEFTGEAWPSIPALLGAMRDGPEDLSGAAEYAIRQIGEGAIPTCLEAVRHGGPETRRLAMKGLAATSSRTDTATPILLELLGDPEPEVRDAAADGVWSAPETTIPLLLAALSHDDPFVREPAVSSLAKFAALPAVAIPAISRLLRDDYREVRLAAAQALGTIGEAAASAVPALVRALADHDADVRADAASALALIGPAAGEALPALERTLEDPDERVQREAESAIESIQRK